MIKKLKNQLVRLVNKLKNKLQRWTCRFICISGVHTQPRWIQSSYPWPEHYYGECRNCKFKLTPNYTYSDTKGPLYQGLEEYTYTNPIYRKPGEVYTKYTYRTRNLESIIEACVNMFIKDLPTNQSI